jgi:hypothetical protein
VNGVSNTKLQALNSAAQLAKDIQKSLEPGCPVPEVTLAYNTSAGLIRDLAQALIQISNGVDDNDADLAIHIRQYRDAISAGKKVVVVAHSQGNLYANKEFDKLAALPILPIGEHFAIVAVATPASFVAPFPAGSGPYVTLGEDLFANVGFMVVNPSVLPPNTINFPICGYSIDCHRFVDAYLRGGTSGPKIVDKVLAALRYASDNFNDNSLNSSIWNRVIVPSGAGTIIETNQRIEMTRSIPGSVYQGLQSRCKLRGDFDAQVDFRLLNWPAQNFNTVRFAVMDLPGGPLGQFGIMRNSYADEIYQMRGAAGVEGEVSRSDLVGTLRLKRIGTTLQGYYWNGSGFAPLGSSTTSVDDTRLMVDFSFPAGIPATTANVMIAIDNFKVNQGVISTCQ